MKVLFICSGNKSSGIGTVVKNQAESLIKNGIEIDYFPILGKGFLGYLKNIMFLSHHLKKHTYDIIHAHYSLSAIVASFAYSDVPLVVSLMGSDAKMNLLWRITIQTFARYFWKVTIVKSNDMKESLRLTKSHVIPNGVEINNFSSFNRKTAKLSFGFDQFKKHIVFIANPSRKEKNFKLAQSAIALLNNEQIVLHTVFDKHHSEVIKYLYAADVLILTSKWEGSPNIIKEAMSANCPIVATDVGDIRWLLGDEPGHFLTDKTPQEVAQNIQRAINYVEIHNRTKGRQRLLKLGLDDKTIANRIISLYYSITPNI